MEPTCVSSTRKAIRRRTLLVSAASTKSRNFSLMRRQGTQNRNRRFVAKHEISYSKGYKTSANGIAYQLRSEPHLAIIRLMTWEEFQDLHLEVAREVGAERDLRVRLAEPEDLHDPACDY